VHRAAGLAAILLLAPIALTACTTSVGSCTDYAAYPTPQERFDAAPVVVVATVTRTGRTIEPDAVYPMYRARVVDVVKGDLPRRTIELYNPSDQCITYGQPAPRVEPDVLKGVGRAVLYLSRDAEDAPWHLVVPNGVDSLPERSPLPFTTASPSPTPSPTPTPTPTPTPS
jgi:hypothetical protein